MLRRRTYGASYYGRGRDASSRHGLSGYERYTRASSNADVAAYLLWRFFPPGRVLDAGCAQGFVVEALREVGVDAEGIDASRYAITHASPATQPFVRRADVTKRLPFPSESFDVVAALETLEHVRPALVPRAVQNLRRVCRGWLVATIPSFGPNASGPPGWLEGKVRHERIGDLYALGPEYDGPIDEDDLARDARGALVEGHVAIASYRWWTQRFADAGFVRCPAMERRLHPHIARFGLTTAWCLYVFRLPETPLPPIDIRDPEVFTAREHAWGLDTRRPSSADLDLLRLAGLATTAGADVGAHAERP